MMKMAKKAKTPEPVLDDTFEEDQTMNESEQVEQGESGVEHHEVSQAYDADDVENDENSPVVANLEFTPPAEGKGMKRKKAAKDAPEVVVQEKGRKKQKTPEKSIFDPDSEVDPLVVNTDSVDTKPIKGKAPRKQLRSKASRKMKPSNDNAQPKAVVQEVEEEKPPVRTKSVRVAKAALAAAAGTSKEPNVEMKQKAKPAAKTTVTKVKIHAASKDPESSHVEKVPMAEMLKITMDHINDARKGISFAEVKRYLSSNFDYHNILQIKKGIKSRLESGEFVKTTGVGLNGKFKLAPKRKKKATPNNSVASAAPVVEKPRKSIGSMKQVKANKKRKSVAIKADKVPKTKKAAANTSNTTTKVKKGRQAKSAKTTDKAAAPVVKKTTGKIKAR